MCCQLYVFLATPDLRSLLLGTCLLIIFREKDLSAAVDVYSEWVDACDAVAKVDGGGDFDHVRNSAGGMSTARHRDGDEEEDLADLIDDDDEEGAGGGYGGEGIVADDDEY